MASASGVPTRLAMKLSPGTKMGVGDSCADRLIEMSGYIWLWVKKMPTLEDHRFWFIFPFSNSFFWVPGILDPQPYVSTVFCFRFFWDFGVLFKRFSLGFPFWA